MFVLVIRPRASATRTASTLAALGHQALIDPVIEIEPRAFDLTEAKFEAVAFTSANAVHIASAYAALKSVPVFAVGTRTAEAAREVGFSNIEIAAGDVLALGEALAAKLTRGARVLHLGGEDRAGDLAGDLAKHGITVEARVIYRARAATKLSAETAAYFRTGKIAAVLHYSERSAAVFVRLADAAGITGDIRKTRHLCLSANVAAPLKAADVAVEIAPAPNETALIGLLDV